MFDFANIHNIFNMDKKSYKQCGGHAVGMQKALCRRHIAIGCTQHPPAVDIAQHPAVQPVPVWFGHLRKGETPGGAEGGHQQLVVGIGLTEGLFPEGAVGLVPSSLFDVGNQRGASVGKREAVSSGAETKIGCAVPIAAIVLRFEAWTSIVAYLILVESIIQKTLMQSMILPHHLLLVR